MIFYEISCIMSVFSMADTTQRSFTIFGCIVWMLAALFFLYEFFLRTFIGTLAGEITKALSLNAEHLSLIGGAYFITYGIMQVFVGLFIDTFGAKKLLTSATFICVAGVFLFSFAHNFSTLLISRLLMGLGSSFGFVCLLMLSLSWFPRKHFGFLSGLSQFIGALGPLLAGAPLIIMLAKIHDNWRLAVTYVGFFGLILGLLIWIFVKDKPENNKEKITILIISKPIYRKLIGFLRNIQTWLIICYATLVNSALAMLGIVWGTTYLETLKMSAQKAAFISSLIWLGYAVGSPILGAISDHFARRKIPLLFCAVIGACLIALMLYTPTTNPMLFMLIFFGLGVAGAGQGLAFALMSEQARPEIHATGFGLNNAFIMLSTSILIPFFGFLINISQKKSAEAIGHYHLQDFRTGLLFLLAIYLIATIITLFFIKETFCKQQDVTITLEVP